MVSTVPSRRENQIMPHVAERPKSEEEAEDGDYGYCGRDGPRHGCPPRLTAVTQKPLPSCAVERSGSARNLFAISSLIRSYASSRNIASTSGGCERRTPHHHTPVQLHDVCFALRRAVQYCFMRRETACLTADIDCGLRVFIPTSSAYEVSMLTAQVARQCQLVLVGLLNHLGAVPTRLLSLFSNETTVGLVTSVAVQKWYFRLTASV